MIRRFLRQLRGKGERMQEAEAELHAHHRAMNTEIDKARREVVAVEKLIKEFRKDLTQWPLR